MSDEVLRDIERRFQGTGAPDDEGRLLLERVRAGQISPQVLIHAAVLGSEAARIADPDFRERVLEILTTPEMDIVLRLVHISPKAGVFLKAFSSHDKEARDTLTHYQLVQDDDKNPPDTATVRKALFEHLGSHPSHLEAIAQMQRPVLQLIPIHNPQGPGFQRMVDAINVHRREGQEDTFVRRELGIRWGMNSLAPAKIVGWQVVVVEGVKELPGERNRHRNEPLGEQLRLWQEECEQRGLQLCDNRSHALLQMQEIRTAPAGTPLGRLGIDPETSFTVLKDSTRPPGSLVPYGYWSGGRVTFNGYRPGDRDLNARVRFAVVVQTIL